MIRYVLAAAILSLPPQAHAQQPAHEHSAGMTHGHHEMTDEGNGGTVPSEPGQGAFAAIQEIVAMLDSDPKTDWSKVDIEALRRHLADMSNVTLYAEATAAPVESGIRYTVTGTGAVRASIRRMVFAHARTMNGQNGMTIVAEEHPEGAVMTVTVADAADLPKLEGLGFIGVMTLGAHHQQHHLAIARGSAPH